MLKQLAAVMALLVGIPALGAADGNLQFLDLDKDGYISKEEIKGIPDLTQRWDELDINQDGRLDEAEFARFENQATPLEPAPPQ